MKMPGTINTGLLVFVLLLVVDSSIAQEVRIRPNDAATEHVMIEPLNTQGGVFLGDGAGRINTGAQNTFVGFHAGNVNTTANDNTFIGYRAGVANSIGQQNTFLGAAAGLANQTASFNTMLGSFAGLANTTGSSNTFVGQAAGNGNTAGFSNTFLGRESGFFNEVGFSNTFVGQEAGKLNVSGDNSTYVGYQSGRNSNGGFNSFLGAGAGYDNTSGTRNTFLGFQAGYSNSTAANNTFIGTEAGFSNTAAADNTFIGVRAGYANTAGLQNTFVGVAAGGANVTGNFSTIIGSFAGPVATGTSNTFIGQAAGNVTTTGSNNTFIGRNAGAGNTTGSGNVYIGFNAGATETSSNKLFIHNTNAGSGSALIYGDFASKLLKFNSHVGINQVYTGTALNVRSDNNDFMVLSTEDETGEDLLTVRASGTVFVKDSIGVGVFDPEANLHIKNADAPRILVQSDGTNEESGRVSLRQSNGSGADILYDGRNTDDVFAIETFTSGNTNGKKFTLKLNGNVGIGVDSPDEKLHVDGNAIVEGKISGLSDPIAAQDAATKAYVDASISTYTIGDFAHGGIVFWVDDTGQHGLVCAKIDQSASIRWYAGTNGNTRAKGDGIYAGKANTNIIISSQVAIGDDGQDYAAQICNDLQITEGGVTYGDWYLPSKMELNLMLQNATTINASAAANGGSPLSGGHFWSSTENLNSAAWSNAVGIVNFPLSQFKNAGSPVRAIRSF